MATSEERMKILKMIEEGKITADEGARLLAALRESRRTPSGKTTSQNNASGARWLRIRVTDTTSGKTKATVNLPLRMMDAGLNIASQYAPDVAFDELMDAIKSGAHGKLIDVVDKEDSERVEIFIE
ncbi:MAG: hypothetical protein JW908_08630 [Anaerolineales bacterium]|nr:hypothetical protein [Anaerolineales bacterium]